MATTRRQYSAKFKARVAVEAIRGEKTLNQLGSQFGLHPVQIAHWRRTALDHIEELFVDGRTRHSQEAEAGADRDALFEEIGRLKVELDFVKKKSWHARVRTDVCWWNQGMRRSASGGNASCWASAAPVGITNRRARARRTCG